MKFGSVEFFKKLIVGGFILLILLPVVLAIVFGILYAKQKGRADQLEQINAALLESADISSIEDFPPEVMQYMQNPAPTVPTQPSFDYQKDYPDLYVQRPDVVPTEGKVCYLTFDDGPSPVTMQILKTLADYDIKATFFVTGENSEKNEEVLLAAADAGHMVAVHTYSHQYKEIYASVDAYLQDFEQMQNRITELTGQTPGIFRFAGGSVNVHNQYIYTELIAEMTRRGFVFYDWNAAGNDAISGGATRSEITNSVLQGTEGKDRVIVLLHDRQDNASTAAALPGIIEGLQKQGYEFAVLGPEVEPITFFYQQ